MLKTSLHILFISLFLFSCGEDGPTEEQIIQDRMNKWNQQKSTDFNQELVQEEKFNISVFLAGKSKWEMEETGSGLMYWIYKDSVGETIPRNKTAEVEFKVSLLDGTECYSTEEGMINSFVVDRSLVESGIHEGIKLLSKGDKAKFIIPSHLAHGLAGDFAKIPPLEALVVDIYLIDYN